ncbi:hypothetical protein DL768_003592 [Monosporascus sp. mg162]|nr:hypothetical protein DL768_003592 [Monosporascus sp. mg162]
MAELVQNMPEPLSERVMVPIGRDGASCTLSCYEYLRRLRAACKVDHDPTRCVCLPAGRRGLRAPVFFAPSLPARARIVQDGEDPDAKVPEEVIPEWFSKELRERILGRRP